MELYKKGKKLCTDKERQNTLNTKSTMQNSDLICFLMCRQGRKDSVFMLLDYRKNSRQIQKKLKKKIVATKGEQGGNKAEPDTEK